MEPITHNVLVHMLKFAITNYGLSIPRLCVKLGIPEDELIGVLEHRQYARIALFARLGHVFRADWSDIAERYTAWRYQQEAAKAKRQLEGASQPAPTRDDDALRVARQIVRDNANVPAEILAQQLHMELTMMDARELVREAKRVRADQSAGDYNFIG